MNMMSINLGVEMGLGGGSKARFVMAARLIQRQVKHHTEMRNKWREVVQGIQAGKTFDVTLKVQAASKNSHLKQRISVFKVTTHAAPASDDDSIKEGQTLSSEDQISQFQYGLEESYREDKNLITLQQSDGGKILIKMPGSSVQQAALAGLLIISIQLILLNKEPPKEAVLLGLLVAVLLHQLRKGANHSGDGLLTSSNKGLLQLLSVIGLMGSIADAHAEDPSNTICLIDSALNAAADGNVVEGSDNFKAAGAVLLAVMVVGGASLWLLKRLSKFEINQGLKRTPVARKSNPLLKIPPKVELEEALLY